MTTFTTVFVIMQAYSGNDKSVRIFICPNNDMHNCEVSNMHGDGHMRELK